MSLPSPHPSPAPPPLFFSRYLLRPKGFLCLLVEYSSFHFFFSFGSWWSPSVLMAVGGRKWRGVIRTKARVTSSSRRWLGKAFVNEGERQRAYTNCVMQNINGGASRINSESKGPKKERKKEKICLRYTSDIITSRSYFLKLLWRKCYLAHERWVSDDIHLSANE